MDTDNDPISQTVGTTGSTPLHFAAANGCLTVVDILLRHGAIVDMADKVRCSLACTPPSKSVTIRNEMKRNENGSDSLTIPCMQLLLLYHSSTAPRLCRLQLLGIIQTWLVCFVSILQCNVAFRI